MAALGAMNLQQGEAKGVPYLLQRAATASGRACGAPEFVELLYLVMGRSLQVIPRGRPRKSLSMNIQEE